MEKEPTAVISTMSDESALSDVDDRPWTPELPPPNILVDEEDDFSYENAPDGTDPASGCLKALRRRHEAKRRTLSVQRPYAWSETAWTNKKLNILIKTEAGKTKATKQAETNLANIVTLLRELGNPVDEWRALILHGEWKVLRHRCLFEASQSGASIIPRVQYGGLEPRMKEQAVREKWCLKYESLLTRATVFAERNARLDFASDKADFSSSDSDWSDDSDDGVDSDPESIISGDHEIVLCGPESRAE